MLALFCLWRTKLDTFLLWHGTDTPFSSVIVSRQTPARVTNRRTLTPEEHQADTRELRAFAGEVDNRVDIVEARIDALEQQQGGEFPGALQLYFVSGGVSK